MSITVKTIIQKKSKGEKIVALTAYDFPTAKLLDESEVDIVLVGDSLGMVVLGYSSTVPVTMREMLHHTKAVSRAVKDALIVGDMPFGSYDTEEKALRNAKRFLKEGGAHAVKLEGASNVEKQVKALVKAGIPVMGHIGMTPQTATALGGYKVQGKEAPEAKRLQEEAELLEKAGVFALVLECVPATLAAKITALIHCPTIGIGAGAGTDGQILVLNDMLGYRSQVSPKFVKRFADLDQIIRGAVASYRKEVLSGKYPSGKESY